MLFIVFQPLQGGHSTFLHPSGRDRNGGPHLNTTAVDIKDVSIPHFSGTGNGKKKSHRRSSTEEMAPLAAGLAGVRRGISDPEYHSSNKGQTTMPIPDDYIEFDKKSSNRGKYRCGRCGQPKVRNVFVDHGYLLWY